MATMELITTSLVVITLAGSGVASLPWTAPELEASAGAFRAAARLVLGRRSWAANPR